MSERRHNVHVPALAAAERVRRTEQRLVHLTHRVWVTTALAVLALAWILDVVTEVIVRDPGTGRVTVALVLCTLLAGAAAWHERRRRQRLDAALDELDDAWEKIPLSIGIGNSDPPPTSTTTCTSPPRWEQPVTTRTVRVTLEPIEGRPFDPGAAEHIVQHPPKFLVAHQHQYLAAMVVPYTATASLVGGDLEFEAELRFTERWADEQIDDYVALITDRPAEWGGALVGNATEIGRIYEISPAMAPPAVPGDGR